jgi:hypothetical protein
MKMIILLSCALFLGSNAFAHDEQMQAMPILKESKSYTVPNKEAGEDLQDQRGFGDQEREVSMMNLMMVEGSGYEGMDMSDMKMGGMKMAGTQSPPVHKPMNMAGTPTDESKIVTTSDQPSGDHMKMDEGEMGSMKMSGTPNSAKKSGGGTATSLDVNFTKSHAPAKNGPNIFEFTVIDNNGKEMRGLKLTAQVYMLSMDMGTDTPRVREIKPGTYQTKAVFSMSGPWALKIISSSGEKIIEVQVTK